MHDLVVEVLGPFDWTNLLHSAGQKKILPRVSNVKVTRGETPEMYSL